MLGVTASLTAGDLRYDTHGAHVAVRRGLLPIIDRAEFRVPRSVQVDAAAGDDMTLALDGGEGAEDVFTGTVATVRRSLLGASIVGHGGAAALAAYRPAQTLEELAVGDAVGRLCGDAGVEADVGDGPTLAHYVANGQATALDLVVRLLHLAGQVAAFDAGGTLVGYEDEPATERALRYGREIVAVDVSTPPSGGVGAVVVGEGAGGPDASNALWPIADFWAGGAATPGPEARVVVAPELRTTGDAEAAGTAWGSRQVAAWATVRLRCWLLPAVAPNDLVEVQDAPEDVGVGKVRVRQVVHRIDPARGATTDIWGYDDGAASEGLAGALAGLLGGLL
jgi:hypothetical protein